LSGYDEGPWCVITSNLSLSLNHSNLSIQTFTNNTKIAANIKSGHVYSYEAVKELNIRAKNWTDLVTGEKFSKSDIVILQDPSDITEVPIPDLSSLKEKKTIKPSEATKRVLEEMKRKKLLSEKDKTKPRSRFTSGKCAASFTSTAVDIHTTNERAIASKAEIEKLRYERVRKLKKKGYVRLVTNRGNLNLELHCDMVPRTCENFIRLASSGYYDGILFHRLIRNFMIQGGDPTGTGRSGESIWKKPFKDEFNRKLSHEGRGVLSMANSGPNTNGSQFFITFKTCRHLDKKHSVFGSVVGGMDVLNSMERVETDSNDRPKEDLKIMRCDVFVNPYDEVAETDGKKAVTRTSTKKKKRKKSNNQWGVRSFDDDYDQGEEVLMKKRKVENGSSKIGKYLNL
jgi:peptidyl-prolyl cis-trans isomerase-like 2